MFTGYSDKTLEFMWGIRLNNDRTWFTTHKDDYLQHLYQPTMDLGREVYDRFMDKFPKLDLNLHVCRIYRDARRLHGQGRRDIDENPARLEKLVRRLRRDGRFQVQGKDYARPKGNPSPLTAEWYNKRDISVGCQREFDQLACSPALVDELVDGFIFLEPVYQYFQSFCKNGLEDLK